MLGAYIIYAKPNQIKFQTRNLSDSSTLNMKIMQTVVRCDPVYENKKDELLLRTYDLFKSKLLVIESDFLYG